MIDGYRPLLDRLLPDESELVVREGQFHHVVIGTDRVVCIARTTAAAARLARRAAMLDALRDLELGVAVPNPLAVSADNEVPHLVLSRIHGETLERSAVGTPAIAAAVARECHALLTRLAAAGSNETLRATLPHAPADRWPEFAAAVRDTLYPLMTAAGSTRAEEQLAALNALPHSTVALVHGDLGGENLLWNTESAVPVLCGVVDWDGACLGDPAEDIAAIAATYGEPVLGRLLDLDATAGLPARVAAIRGTFALQQALAAHSDGDEDELAEGLAGYVLPGRA